MAVRVGWPLQGLASQCCAGRAGRRAAPGGHHQSWPQSVSLRGVTEPQKQRCRRRFCAGAGAGPTCSWSGTCAAARPPSRPHPARSSPHGSPLRGDSARVAPSVHSVSGHAGVGLPVPREGRSRIGAGTAGGQHAAASATATQIQRRGRSGHRSPGVQAAGSAALCPVRQALPAPARCSGQAHR